MTVNCGKWNSVKTTRFLWGVLYLLIQKQGLSIRCIFCIVIVLCSWQGTLPWTRTRVFKSYPEKAAYFIRNQNKLKYIKIQICQLTLLLCLNWALRWTHKLIKTRLRFEVFSLVLTSFREGIGILLVGGGRRRFTKQDQTLHFNY